MGVVGLTVPETYGGLGLGLLDLVLLLEEAGRSGLPEPLLETVALAVPVLVEATSERAHELRARWLPAVAAGEAVVAVGTEAMPSVPGAVGRRSVAPEPAGPRSTPSPARPPSGCPGPALDGARRLADVSWEPSPATLLAAGTEASALLGRLGGPGGHGHGGRSSRGGRPPDHHDGRLRRRPGPVRRPHRILPGREAPSGQRPHPVSSSPGPPSTGPPGRSTKATPTPAVHASMAKALASDAATAAARIALQVHGAIGYTWEHDLHLWMKRAWSLAAAWGDARHHRARVLEILLDPTERDAGVVSVVTSIVETYLADDGGPRLRGHGRLPGRGRRPGRPLRRHLYAPGPLRGHAGPVDAVAPRLLDVRSPGSWCSDDRQVVVELSETVEIDGAPLVTPEALVFDLNDDGLIAHIAIYIQTLPRT